MQKLYPGFRTSWFKTPGDRSYNAGWGETKKRWFIVEAYPLFVAIGGGCGICFLHCMRHFMFSPDVSPALPSATASHHAQALLTFVFFNIEGACHQDKPW